MKREPIILASASPRRQAILRKIKVPFEVHLPVCDEIVYPDDPVVTVGTNARRKAFSVQLRYPHSTVLAADTVVAFQGRVLGKPKSTEEAQEWLLSYSGRSQLVYTAVAFALPGCKEVSSRIEVSSLRFKEYGLDTVQRYLNRVQPFDRAGAYDINAHGDWLIDTRVGSYTNVMGLPQEVVRDWLIAHLPQLFIDDE